MAFLRRRDEGTAAPDPDHLRITVLLPTAFNWPSGGYKVAYEYASRLSARGHVITLVHIVEFGDLGDGVTLRDRLLNWCLPVRRKRPKWFHLDRKIRSYQWLRWSRAAIRGADVVIATAWRTAEKLQHHHNGYYLIQSYETWAGPADRVDRTWLLPLHKIVIAGWLAEKSTELGGGQTELVPNAIDGQVFGIDVAPAERSSDEIAMLWHHLKLKGSEDGLTALHMVRDSRPNLHVTLFSSSKVPPDLPPWITFVRNADQSTLRTIYNTAAVFVSPSHFEGWPLPPAEAMICGAALASTDIGGVRDYAHHGTTALLSPVEDPRALATNIAALLDDVDLRVRIASAGHRLISERFNWDRSTDTLEEILRRNLVAPTRIS